MKITEALLAEHLVFHNLFDHIEAAAPKLRSLAEMKVLAAALETMLKSHAVVEDALFIGPLEHCFEEIGQRDAFLKEHEEMDGNLRRVRSARQVSQARKLLLAAVDYSREHFCKEEHFVFPMAERVLNAKTLNALGQRWIDNRAKSRA